MKGHDSGPPSPPRPPQSAPELLPVTHNEPVRWRELLDGLQPILLVAGDATLTVAVQIVHRWAVAVPGNGPEPGSGEWWPGVVSLVAAVVGTIGFLAIYRGYRELHRSVFEWGRDVFTAGLWSTLPAAAAARLFHPARPTAIFASVPTGVALALLLILWRVPFARRARRAWQEPPVALVSTRPEVWKERLPAYVRVHPGATPARRFLITPDVPLEERARIVSWALAHRVEVYLVPEAYEIALASSRAVHLDDVLLLKIHPVVLPRELRALKRGIDLLGAAVLGCLSIPLFVLAATLIWLEDRGPVFYRQRRVGRDGRCFELLKFRTMVPDAEKGTGPLLAQQDDPRITRIGQILRNIHIDELPQLWNVLRGEMRLVGPRPERPEIVRDIAGSDRLFRLREGVRPGITGHAQLFGRYDSDPASKLRMDLHYISGWNPVRDVVALLRTIPLLYMPDLLRRLWRRSVRRRPHTASHQGAKGDRGGSVSVGQRPDDRA